MCWPEIIDVVQKIVATLAFAVGALWVLWNYWRGRTHRPRVQFRISGHRLVRDGMEYLVVNAELANVGLGRVKLNQDKGGVRAGVDVYAHHLPKKVGDVMGPRWEKPIATFRLFDWTSREKYVEPNGLMTDQLLVALPGRREQFLRIDGYVESRKVAWLSRVVVEPPGLERNPRGTEVGKPEESHK